MVVEAVQMKDDPLDTPQKSQRGPKFRRRAEARPDEVLDAALDLFIERGFPATRVEDIAKKAGLSKGAVYLYFPSKESILEALVRRAMVPIAASASQILDLSTDDPRQLLTAAATLMAERLSEPKLIAVPKLVMREVAGFPQLAEMYRREVIDQALPVLIRLVERGVDEGIFRPVDPEFAVRSILGPIFFHLIAAELFGVLPERGLDLSRFVDQHLDILFNGLTLPGSADNA